MAKPNGKRAGGLGRGLAALIPEGGTANPPRLGGAAADVLFNGPKPGQHLPSSRRPQPGAAATTSNAGTNNERATSDTETPDFAGVATYKDLPLAAIVPNPKQPRKTFDPDELAELSHSIKEFGLLQPIVVRPQGGQYELIMGERRLRAAKQAGLTRIPAIVRLTEDGDMLRDALLENIHRVQLNPLEEAAAYKQLLEEFNVTQAELAEKLGRSRPVISNMIRLLGLPVSVQMKVSAGVLSAGHARAILGLTGGEAAMEALAEQIINEGMSVRATEEAVVLLNNQATQPEAAAKPAREKPALPEAMSSAAERFADRLDTRVTVQMGRKKGRIVVEFAGQDDFERIMGILGS